MPTEFLKNLSPNQRKAVESEARSLLVLAGPGTGKTRVLVSRILHLLNEQCSPERILALTFSKKATHEMEERLLSSRPEMASRVEISTLHAFCVNLVQQQGFRLGLRRKLELLSESQSHLLFRRQASQLPFQFFVKSSSIDSVIDDLLIFFQDCKDEGLWPENLMSFAQSLPDQTEDDRVIKQEWVALGDLYNAFQSYCFEEGRLDFGDAVLGALRLLDDHPIVTKNLQDQYDHILVDEFQDTNWTQIQFLRKICGPRTQIFVVGDDDQAIYRFRGASYSAFQFFEELFPQPEFIELNETYRLSKSVAAVATSLIQANGSHRYRPDKSIVSLKKDSPIVTWAIAQSFDDEARWIKEKITQLIDQGVAPFEIGILVRSHAHAEKIYAQLLEAGIPTESSKSVSFENTPILQDALSFFQIFRNPADNISLLRLLDSPFLRLKAEDIFLFCESAKFGKLSYFQHISPDVVSGMSDEARGRLLFFKEFIEKNFSQGARQPASHLLLRWVEDSEVIPYLLTNSRKQEIHELALFLRSLQDWEITQKGASLFETLDLLESMKKERLSFGDEESSFSPNHQVRILTVHASKGLEFDYVFVPSLVGRRFPSTYQTPTWILPDEVRKERAPNKQSHLEEERRLLYVAITRAKEKLFLSSLEKKGTRASLFVSEDIEKKVSPAFFEKIRIDRQTPEAVLSSMTRSVFSRASARENSPVFSKKDRPLSLSFSQLDKFDKCPLSYWFAFELRIPSPPHASLLTGSAIHEALEVFYQRIKNESAPAEEELLKIFETIFHRIQNETGGLSSQDLELAKTKLSDFYRAQKGVFVSPLALEKEFVFKVGEHSIKGKIDRVDQDGDGVQIIDYKTGKSRNSADPEDQKFAEQSLQFSIYALAARECFDWNVKALSFYYVYDNQVLTTTRNEEQLAKTKEKILDAAARIQAGNFEPKPGFICQWCEFQKICPSSKLNS